MVGSAAGAHWTPRECLEALSDERASIEDWLELADVFASRLGEGGVRRGADGRS